MISRSWQMRRVMAKLLLLVERSCSIPPLLIVPKSATGRPLQRRPRGRLVQDVWYRTSGTGCLVQDGLPGFTHVLYPYLDPY